jgi:cell division septation protein DedD
VLLYNPGEADATATMDLFNAADQAAGQATAAVPAGGLAWLRVTDVAAFPAGVGRAVVRANGPLAALVYDERDQSQDPAGNVHTITLLDYMDSGLRGTATLTEKGADLEVALALSGSGAGPGTRFGAAVRSGQCGMAFQVAYALDEVRDGRSTTLLKNVGIAKLTALPHAIVISRPGAGGLPPMDVMCGFVEEIHLGERIDTTLASAVRLAAGGAVTPPPPTTPARTNTPAPSASATPSPTRDGSATTPPPSPTPTNTPRGGGDGKVRAYLPFARK